MTLFNKGRQMTYFITGIDRFCRSCRITDLWSVINLYFKSVEHSVLESCYINISILCDLEATDSLRWRYIVNMSLTKGSHTNTMLHNYLSRTSRSNQSCEDENVMVQGLSKIRDWGVKGLPDMSQYVLVYLLFCWHHFSPPNWPSVARVRVMPTEIRLFDVHLDRN